MKTLALPLASILVSLAFFAQPVSGLRLPVPAALLVGLAPPPATPARTVEKFYAFHFAHDMAFTPDSVRAKADWLAPDLLSLCEKYFERPSSPDEVPPINGDPFTDSQEYPKRFRVGAARVSGEAAWVPVRFDRPRGRPRTVTAHLVRIAGRWRVWNVRWEDGSSLRELLERGQTPVSTGFADSGCCAALTASRGRPRRSRRRSLLRASRPFGSGGTGARRPS